MVRLLASLLLPLRVGWAADVAPDLLREEDVTVNCRNGTYFANLSLQVPALPARVLAALTDFEHMPDFAPNLHGSRVMRWREIMRRQGRAEAALPAAG